MNLHLVDYKLTLIISLCLILFSSTTSSQSASSKVVKKENINLTFKNNFRDDFMKDDDLLASKNDLKSFSSIRSTSKHNLPSPFHDKMIKSSPPTHDNPRFTNPLNYGRETEPQAVYKLSRPHRFYSPNNNGLTMKRPNLSKSRYPGQINAGLDDYYKYDNNYGKGSHKYDNNNNYRMQYFAGKRPFKTIRDNYFGSSKISKRPYRTSKYRSKYSHHYHYYYPSYPGGYQYEIYHYYHSLPSWYLHLLMLLEQLYRNYGDFDPYFDPYFFWPIWNRPYSYQHSSSYPTGSLGGYSSNYPSSSSYDYYRRSKKLKMG